MTREIQNVINSLNIESNCISTFDLVVLNKMCGLDTPCVFRNENLPSKIVTHKMVYVREAFGCPPLRKKWELCRIDMHAPGYICSLIYIYICIYRYRLYKYIYVYTRACEHRVFKNIEIKETGKSS